MFMNANKKIVVVSTFVSSFMQPQRVCWQSASLPRRESPMKKAGLETIMPGRSGSGH